MKLAIMTLLLCLCLVTIAQAQTDFNDFFKKYKDAPGMVVYDEPVISETIDVKKSTGDNFWTFYRKCERTRLLYMDAEHPELLKEMKANLPGKNYREVGLINDRIRVKFRESRKAPNEILIQSSKPGSLCIVCITGDFNYQDAKHNLNSINSFIRTHNIVFAQNQDR